MRERDGSPPPVSTVPCVVVSGGSQRRETRQVIREAPLLLTVQGRPLAALHRTPGFETDLALGYLLTEGVVANAGQVVAQQCVPQDLSPVPPAEKGEAITEVRLTLAEGVRVEQGPFGGRLCACSLYARHALERAAIELMAFARPPGRWEAGAILSALEAMRARQELFALTGATHAAGLMLPDAAGPVLVREDIGRHNALDKVIGAAVHGGLPLDRALLILSGRLSVEMVAKAARVGLSDVVGVSAPTALAVEFAQAAGMFLAGFARQDTMTVYTGEEALASA
jgi:FdhD protein